MSFFNALYNLPQTLVTAVMSNPFRRFRWSSAPAPKAVEAAPKVSAEEEAASTAEDQKLLEKTINDAVNAALNNEAFTKAVADHLALQVSICC